MVNSSAPFCETDFFQPEESAIQTLKLISSMLKHVVATLDKHVELLQEEHQVVNQIRDRQTDLVGADMVLQDLKRSPEQDGKNRTSPASLPGADRGPGQA